MSEPRSTAPWDQPRKSTTVTVTVVNPRTATDQELLVALARQQPRLPGSPLPREQAVEYVNWHRDDGRVCFCVSWRNPNYKEVT